MTFEHTCSFEGPASVAGVWALWSDVSRWPEWDPSLESASCAGPFAVGSSGVMEVKGQGSIGFVLVAVEERAGFTNETSVPGALIRFGHRVEPVGAGVRVSYDVVVEGPAAARLGPVVVAELPAALELLVELAS